MSNKLLMPFTKYFILDKDKNLVSVKMIKWAEFIESGQNIVKQENVDEWLISTILLGLDSGYRMNIKNHKPLIFETMVDHSQGYSRFYRTCTYNEALNKHNKMIKVLERLIRIKNARKNRKM